MVRRWLVMYAMWRNDLRYRRGQIGTMEYMTLDVLYSNKLGKLK